MFNCFIIIVIKYNDLYTKKQSGHLSRLFLRICYVSILNRQFSPQQGECRGRARKDEPSDIRFSRN